MHIFLDDLRPLPEVTQFSVVVRDAGSAIEQLRSFNVRSISFDHDLGQTDLDLWSWITQAEFQCGLDKLSDSHLPLVDCGNGYLVARWIAIAARDLYLPRLQWAVHSANPVGRHNIEAAMRQAEQVWNERDF
jgi:hypothetical protein